MPFTNPLVAGNTLIRESIQSPNYVAGVSGWTINKDGSAEFNNVVIRGTVSVTGSNNSQVVISTVSQPPESVAVIDLYPGDYTDGATPTPGAGQISAASIASVLTSTHYGQLNVESPGNAYSSSLVLTSDTLEGGGINNTTAGLYAAEVNIGYSLPSATTTTTITGPASVSDTFKIGPQLRDIGRGYYGCDRRTTVSGAVGAAETVAWTLQSRTYKAGRAYEIRGFINFTCNTAGAWAFPRLRKGPGVGQLLAEYGRQPAPTNGVTYIHPTTPQIFVVGNSDVTTQLVVTMQTSSGTVTLFGDNTVGGSGCKLEFFDVGAAADYQTDDPNVAVLV